MFYFFVHYLKKGVNFYRIMVVIAIAAVVYFGIAFRGIMEDNISNEFKALITGTQIIVGSFAAYLISYLFRRDNIII